MVNVACVTLRSVMPYSLRSLGVPARAAAHPLQPAVDIGQRSRPLDAEDFAQPGRDRRGYVGNRKFVAGEERAAVCHLAVEPLPSPGSVQLLRLAEGRMLRQPILEELQRMQGVVA